MTRRALLASLPLLGGERYRPYGFSLKGMAGWDLERSFRLCAELGYTGVELFEPAKLEAREVRRLAGAHRLRIYSIMEDLRLTGDEAGHLERLEGSLRLARETGKPVVETVVGGQPAEWPAVREEFARRLEGWARLAERYRVVVAIKAHIGSALHLPEDAAGLCRRIGSRYVRINYDYSHFQLQGLGLEATLRAAMPYIAMIHVKDFTGTPEKFRFALPGEGSIDYDAYGRLLGQLRYRGPIVVEVSTHVLQRAGYDAEAAARYAAGLKSKFRLGG